MDGGIDIGKPEDLSLGDCHNVTEDLRPRTNQSSYRTPRLPLEERIILKSKGKNNSKHYQIDMLKLPNQ